MAQNQSDNILVDAPKVIDERYGPYASVAAALAGVPSFRRSIGLIIGVISGSNIIDYQFVGGTADSNLQARSSLVGLSEGIVGVNSSGDPITVTLDTGLIYSSGTLSLDSSILNQLELQGVWDATTNTPAIPVASTANHGHFYIVSNSVQSGHAYPNIPDVDYNAGDWILSDGTQWRHVINSAVAQWVTSGNNIYYNVGNVGIGIDSPSHELSVRGVSAHIQITDTSNSTLSNAGVIIGMASSNDVELWNFQNGYFRIATNGSERFRIDSLGNVGIGITSPNAKLDVNGDIQINSAQPILLFDENDQTGSAGLYRLNLSNDSFSLQRNTDSVDRNFTTSNDVFSISNTGATVFGTSGGDTTLEGIRNINGTNNLDLNITPSGTGSIVLGGNVTSTINDGTIEFQLGNAIIGTASDNSSAHFRHRNLADGNPTYALFQSQAGLTFLNSASGQPAEIRVAGNQLITATAIQVEFTPSGNSRLVITDAQSQFSHNVNIDGNLTVVNGGVTVGGNLPFSNFNYGSLEVASGITSITEATRAIQYSWDSLQYFENAVPGVFYDMNATMKVSPFVETNGATHGLRISSTLTDTGGFWSDPQLFLDGIDVNSSANGTFSGNLTINGTTTSNIFFANSGATISGGVLNANSNLSIGGASGYVQFNNGFRLVNNATATNLTLRSNGTLGKLVFQNSTDTLLSEITALNDQIQFNSSSSALMGTFTPSEFRSYSTSVTLDSLATIVPSGQTYMVTSNDSGVLSAQAIPGGGSGTVTSVGITSGNLIDVTGGPITTSGNIMVDVDLSELATSVSDADGDFFAVIDSVNAQRKLTKANINLSGFNNDAGFTTNAGTVTSVGVGTGLNVATPTTTPNVTLDLSEFTDMTAAVVGAQDELILLDNGAQRRKLISEITLGQFNNDQGWTNNTGTITGVTAGTGLSGGGTSGSVSLALDFDELSLGGTLLATDHLIASNGGVENRQLISSIPLSIFNNDAGFVTSAGDMTTNTDQDVTGNKEFQDSIQLRFGNSADMAIYHQANNFSIIENSSTAGRIIIQTTSTSGQGVFLRAADTAGTIKAAVSANISGTNVFGSLQHNDTIRVEGTSSGITYHGSIVANNLGTTPPASATGTGTQGEIRIDANHIYICTATNTWKRAAIVTW